MRTASRSTGGEAMIESSRTPVSASCSVRGIGVAVSVSTCTSARSCFSFSLCATPKCCSSSTISRPRSLNLIALPSSAWVPIDDVDRAVGEPLLHASRAPAPATSREACAILTGKPRKRSREGLVVLARQQRGRHHDRDLLAVHRRDEGGAQRHLGLAEADIAADQPVHRPAGRRDRRAPRRSRPAGRRSPHRGSRRRTRRRARAPTVEPRRLAQLPLGRDLDQLARHLADAALQPRLARLPGAAAEPVELDARSPPSRSATGARCSRPAGTACRRRHSGSRGSRAARPPPRWSAGPTKRPMPWSTCTTRSPAARLVTSAMKFSGRLRGAARPHQAVAEDVLLADDRERRRSRSPASRPSTASATSRLRQRQRLGPVGDDRPRLASPWSASTWLMRSREPSLHSAMTTRLPRRLQRLDVLGHGLEDVAARPRRARARSCGPAACRRRSPARCPPARRTA